jgi:anaerobic magnesium-protoporphyrin IX monomethyl ester cyclase
MPRVFLVKVGHRTARQKFAQPLGVMMLAACLREQIPGTELELHDLIPEELSVAELIALARRFQPDVFGISAMTYESEEMAAVAKAVKAWRPDLPVVVGGPHATTMPRQVLALPEVDVIVRNEGELTFAELVPMLVAGERRPEIPGVGFRKDGQPYLTPPRAFIPNLDALPYPAWDLVRMPRYWDIPRFGTAYQHRKYMSVFTSRACPFNCTYCHRLFGQKFRARSVENVIGELKILYRQYGVREIHFIDDCFNFDKPRAAAICDRIVEEGLKIAINFPNGVRGDIMTPELLQKLKRAGTYRITYAVESGSERVQKYMKKNLKLDKVKEIIAETDRLGILVDGFFMVGFPTETREEIAATLQFALDSKLHSANFFFVTPFEGTELWDQARQAGMQADADPDRYTYFYPETNLSEVPQAELARMVSQTFRRFYLNPWRLWRVLRLFPNKKQLPWLLWLFLKYTLKWN